MSSADVKAVAVDLENTHAVAQFAKQLALDEPSIDVVILNAGIVDARQKNIRRTEDAGFEVVLAVNVINQHLLVRTLLENLQAHAKRTKRQVIVNKIIIIIIIHSITYNKNSHIDSCCVGCVVASHNESRSFHQ